MLGQTQLDVRSKKFKRTFAPNEFMQLRLIFLWQGEKRRRFFNPEYFVFIKLLQGRTGFSFSSSSGRLSHPHSLNERIEIFPWAESVVDISVTEDGVIGVDLVEVSAAGEHLRQRAQGLFGGEDIWEDKKKNQDDLICMNSSHNFGHPYKWTNMSN